MSENSSVTLDGTASTFNLTDQPGMTLRNNSYGLITIPVTFNSTNASGRLFNCYDKGRLIVQNAITVGGTFGDIIYARDSEISFGTGASVTAQSGASGKKYSLVNGSVLNMNAQGDIFPSGLTDGTTDTSSSVI